MLYCQGGGGKRMEEIRIKPCRRCGAQPLVLVGMAVLRGGELRIECQQCGLSGPRWAFSTADGYDPLPILPPLEVVRRQAVASWNLGIDV